MKPQLDQDKLKYNGKVQLLQISRKSVTQDTCTGWNCHWIWFTNGQELL